MGAAGLRKTNSFKDFDNISPSAKSGSSTTEETAPPAGQRRDCSTESGGEKVKFLQKSAAQTEGNLMSYGFHQ